jgi:RNA-directed DNA polymerase
VRERVADKRVLGLVKEFLISGILSEDGPIRGPKTGTPQGGILSPLLGNIALSALDEQFADAWETNMASDFDRARRRRQGLPMYRLVRYADDFVVLVSGTQAHACALKVEVAAVLSPIGLRLSEEKTGVCHIDEGFEFLGWRIQRQRKRGSNKVFIYSWPRRKALASILAKVKAITRQGTNQPLSDLLRQINAALRGWTVYFRHGASKQTFAYLHRFTWLRVLGWLRRKHDRATWKAIRRRYLALPGNRLVPHDGGIELFDAGSVPITRHRYRGTKIANPWTEAATATKTTA